MSQSQRLVVTLPDELVAMVEAKVASGAYADRSEVVCDGLRALAERERSVEEWLKDDAIPAYDAMCADPSRGRKAGDVRWSLDALHRRATKTA